MVVAPFTVFGWFGVGPKWSYIEPFWSQTGLLLKLHTLSYESCDTVTLQLATAIGHSTIVYTIPRVYTCVLNYSTGCVCVCVIKTEGCQQIVFHDPQQLSLKRLDKEGSVVGEYVMGNNVLWKLWNRERDQARTTCIHLFRSMGGD